MVGSILQIAGSLGLFLFGMKIMSDGIQKAAGNRLHSVLNFMTKNRFTAVATGFTMTSLIQSSSATTVMVVSFVNAGLLSLTQASGVIMGANIGTTITGWIVTLFGFKLKIAAFAIPIIGIGLPFYFIKKMGKESIGEILMGFGILFLGLSLLKDSVPDIRSNPEILEFLSRYAWRGLPSFFLFILVGTVLTFIVQSSSAAMAITLTIAYAGWIDFQTAAAIVLGENIGTTITAYLASLSTNTNAKRAARVHTLFNILGVIWMAFIFQLFLKFIDVIVPGEIGGKDGITSHLAMFHTMFNICNTFLLIWFVPQLTFLAKRMVRVTKSEEPEEYNFPYIATSLQDTPELNILKAEMEIRKMFDIVEKMFSMFLLVFNNPEKKMKNEVKELRRMEDLTDRMQEQLSQYLVLCSHENLNDRSLTNVNSMIRVIDELESIGDSCYNLILLSQRRYDKKIPLHPAGIELLEDYTSTVKEFLKFNRKNLNKELSEEDLEKAYKLEKKVNNFRDSLQKESRKRLKNGSDIKGELLYLDILKHIEHIGDFSLNITEALKVIA